ncbi:hypothetical protein CEXT_460411 [Caerostris extrusa]|uniref:Uncharacterized protein n=1 Tax=Caerostris extrusa TaxID=172846 RepID=A0AAV4QD16_CAEEX|nr:hypothetical protein CEXT_460411 [Caerostris extrusa]
MNPYPFSPIIHAAPKPSVPPPLKELMASFSFSKRRKWINRLSFPQCQESGSRGILTRLTHFRDVTAALSLISFLFVSALLGADPREIPTRERMVCEVFLV